MRADAHQPSEHTRHMATKGAPVLSHIMSRRVRARVSRSRSRSGSRSWSRNRSRSRSLSKSKSRSRSQDCVSLRQDE